MDIKTKLPDILKIPPKLTPVLLTFGKYRYILIEGGRGSGKTQTIARILLYIGELLKQRIICGRETQNSIEESVYTVLKDLISNFDLTYDVLSNKLRHTTNLTEFGFKGFREQGAVNIKGLEGVRVLWIDEAQSITKLTLNTIIPTIRDDKAILIFTMNRFMRDDPVYEFLAGRPDCLHIQINYFENPYCPLSIKNEAEIMKHKNFKEYEHIYLGKPLASADDYLFNYDKLHDSLDLIPFGEAFGRQRVMGIDFAAQGNDQCVVTILDRVSNQHWQLTERIAWDEPDTTVSTGKIVNFLGQFKPNVAVMDIGGMGKPVYDVLSKMPGVNKVLFPYDGGSTAHIDTAHYANIRAAGYFLLREWFDQGFLVIGRKDIEVIKQLEKIKFKYRSNGVRIIQAKVDMKKELGYSPDDADSLKMAVWGAVHHLGKTNSISEGGSEIKRVSGSKRKH